MRAAARMPFVNFLLGSRLQAYTSSAPRPSPMDVYNWEQGFFFQDDWKVTPRLTINLGVRYELDNPIYRETTICWLISIQTLWIEHRGRKGASLFHPKRLCHFSIHESPITGPVVTAAQSGLDVGRGLVRMDKNNIAPRIGIALRVGRQVGDSCRLRILLPNFSRAGHPRPDRDQRFNQGLTKRTVDQMERNPTHLYIAWPGFAHGFSPLTGGVISTGLGGLPAINAVPFGLEQPRIQQYNATFEREIMQRYFHPSLVSGQHLKRTDRRCRLERNPTE